ncbi:MAG: hypothetical protein JRC90_12280 [Deltaproteobacteria bacterium]|nr:hypothetical protein [Deltaproteobacteria bacterium]
MGYKFNAKLDNKLYWMIQKNKRLGLPTADIEAQRAALWTEYHNHPKISIGNALIIDDPSVLAKYKHRRPYAPRYRKRPSPTRATGKRIIGFEGTYSIPYQPRKVTKLPETMPSTDHAGWYIDGYWSNGLYVVKAPCPKTRRPLCAINEKARIHLNSWKKNAGSLPPATIGKETYDSKKYSSPLVSIYDEGKKMQINAEYRSNTHQKRYGNIHKTWRTVWSHITR